MLNWFAVLTILCNIYCSQTRFSDKQIIKLQETPDEIPEGGTPHTVSVVMHDKLVDAGKPGDRVEVRSYNFACQLRSKLACFLCEVLIFPLCTFYRSLGYTGP